MKSSVIVRTFLDFFVVIVFLLVLAPVVVIALVSFNPGNDLTFPPQAISLRWYEAFFADSQMTSGLIWSIVVAVAACVLSIVLGTLAAVALTRLRLPFKSTIEAFLLSPLVFPGLILGVALLLASQFVGMSIVLRLILAHTLLGIPFVIRSVMSSLNLFDVAIEDAACVHGASRLRAFMLVTLPSIQGGVAAGAIFAFVVSFGEINATLFLVGPGLATLPIHMFSQIQFGAEQVVVAAASTVQMALVVILIFALEKVGLSVATR
ncbi:ABC transporter permease (plasmid) [Agrobacterium leguminum]|uniref:ABC spermidine/putrescine transporter permease protein n=1 Tax=Agrobacterium deltaense NCPPB 1641 TaxID=1183425 RepID=A0A1S7U9Y0_9HYPH|nr:MULTISPECIES: ABC transporter permease [Agrobacterium]WFS69624.1 ABC transporter permease [Agrobacterium leguminum]CVI63605.1 putative ABC spermidine/putrescine transporter permease protein [Agrobacterium deltaense NCPPB 1641]